MSRTSSVNKETPKKVKRGPKIILRNIKLAPKRKIDDVTSTMIKTRTRNTSQGGKMQMNRTLEDKFIKRNIMVLPFHDQNFRKLRKTVKLMQ